MPARPKIRPSLRRVSARKQCRSRRHMSCRSVLSTRKVYPFRLATFVQIALGQQTVQVVDSRKGRRAGHVDHHHNQVVCGKVIGRERALSPAIVNTSIQGAVGLMKAGRHSTSENSRSISDLVQNNKAVGDWSAQMGRSCCIIGAGTHRYWLVCPSWPSSGVSLVLSPN